MSTPPPARACACCGAPARPPFMAPAAELAPDLDLRPGEPARSTLARWVLTCRQCGASAPDLAVLPAGARETVATAAYRALAGRGPELPFLRWALLAEAAGETDEAAGAVLQAAWALDDAGADAAPLRRRAATLWNQGTTMQDALRMVDAWRRAGALQEAGAHAARLLARPGLDETDAAVLRHQQGLVAAGDTGRHLISGALRPPSRTPHVTHGRTPARRGFWARMAGR